MIELQNCMNKIASEKKKSKLFSPVYASNILTCCPLDPLVLFI